MSEHFPRPPLTRWGLLIVLAVAVTLGAAPAEAQMDTTGAAAFSVSGRVTPATISVGMPVSFEATVTNISAETASFIVNGCPVEYLLDGVFSPGIACAEFARLISLEPGQSITFGPSEAPYLEHQPRFFPLAPGSHNVVLSVPGAGRTRVAFEVLPPSTDFAYLGGRVVNAEGRPVSNGMVFLTRPSPEGLPPAETPPPPSETHAVELSDQGYFLFAGIPPDAYLMRAESQGAVVWFPGTSDPDLAQPLRLPGGTYRRVDLAFEPAGPPPPPPGLYPITGVVTEARPGSLGVPLAGAAVLAIPSYPTIEDSLPTGGLDDTEPGIPFPGRFLAYTGPDGRFEFQVPDGHYRLLAGDLIAHRYQYWNHASRLEDAAWLWVPDPTMRVMLEPRFDLDPLDGLSLATIGGTVLAFDPVHDGPPEPLAGAEVVAAPVVPSQVADPAPHRAVTGTDGSYAMELPADTPYLVSVTDDGYFRQYFQNAQDPVSAEWVDVSPGQNVMGIDFLLQPAGPGPGEGVIEGSVYRTDPNLDCSTGQDCVIPAAGAIVRVTAAYPTFAPYEIRTRVGRDGRYRIEGLLAEPGGSLSYYVSAELPGYEEAFYPGGVPFPQAEPLPVFPGDVADAGRIVLHAGAPLPGDGFVSGRITGPDGAPLADARVRAFLEPEDPAGRVIVGQTGPDGWFHLTGMPEGSLVLVAAEAEGFIPAYYPDAHRWRNADLVAAGGPRSRVEPVMMTLYPALTGGSYLQAGRVRVATADADEDTTFTRTPAYDPQSIALAWHRENLPGAFFYLSNAMSAAPIPLVIAGESTGDNGTVVLTGLHRGLYLAYADRPGYETAWFEGADGVPVEIVLDEGTPAVLADIRLVPLGDDPGGETRAEPPSTVQHVTNAPNPFRPKTTIHFDLVEPCPVTVQIFDYRGRLVRTLLENTYRNAGPNEIPWDGNDGDSRRVSSGVYFYRISTENETVSRKMVVLP